MGFLEGNIRFWVPNDVYLDDYTRILLFGLTLIYCKIKGDDSIICTAKYYEILPSKWIYDDDSNSYVTRYVLYPFIYNLKRILKVETHDIVRIIENICIISWIFVILGFMVKYSLFILCLTVFILYGLFISLKGMTHTHYALLYTFISLNFSSIKPEKLSIDYYISNNINEYNPNGFGLKLAQLFLIYSLAAAGFVKIWLNGIKWLDGKSIYYYLYDSKPLRKDSELSKIMKPYSILFPLLSIATIILEIGSIGALFGYLFNDKKYELTVTIIFLTSVITFHGMIKYTMGPDFMIQTICYIVFIPVSTFYDNTQTNSNSDSPYIYIILGNIVIISLFITLYFRIESYPFSIYPMYALIRDTKMFDFTINPNGLKKKELRLNALKNHVLSEKKRNNFTPGFDATYHFPPQIKKRIKLRLLIYVRNSEDDIFWTSPKIWQIPPTSPKYPHFNNKLTTGIRKRRWCDMLYQMYLDNELNNDYIVLYSGYFMGNHNVKQWKLIKNIKNKYILKYIQGAMEILQRKELRKLSYAIYSEDNDNPKGCKYQFILGF